MKAIIGKIALRTVVFLAGLCLMNYLYILLFYEDDLQEYSSQINQIRDAANADVIYLGESSDVTISFYDIDKRPISGFASDYFPGLTFKRINRDASHGEVYLNWLRRIPENNKIQTVIVTLNVRSFGPEWIYSSLENAVQKNLVLLRPYPPLINRFMLSFKAYDSKEWPERDKQQHRFWKKHPLPVPDDWEYHDVVSWTQHIKQLYPEKMRDDSVDLACKFLQSYGYVIYLTDNPRIKDFDKIIDLAGKRNWNLVFNLLSENVEKADSLDGPVLAGIIRKNRDILVEHYTQLGAIVVDNLEAVRSGEFIDTGWATEHYTQKGRMTVAANLADSLKKFHTDQYREPMTSSPYRTTFFQDNDGSEWWGRSNSESSDVAYSGNFSSRTGRGEDYSLTLTYPMKYIPDSAKNSIDISMQIYRTFRNRESLAIAFDSVNMDPQHYSLNDLTHETGKWETLNFNYKIPDSCRMAPLIRIFIYNPTRSFCYMDDLSVKFR